LLQHQFNTDSHIILKTLYSELLTLVYARNVPTKGHGLGPGIPSLLKNPCGQTP